ncbi:type VI secretion protein [Alphaproteobacteria bacterium]|nr:type VI secretion protein [Alphaproteobacteria bacterium]
MALLPHHFQQFDLRFTQLLSHHLNLVSSNHWGVQELLLDESVLPGGLLRVNQAEIVMPDGLIFSYTLKDEKLDVLEVDLTPHKPSSSQEVLTVQLILPAQLEGVSPVRGATPRFKSVEGDPVTDENTEDNPITIPRLIPCFRLHVGNAVPAKHVGFPLVQVRFVDGAFVLADFTPPCFQMGETSHVWTRCLDLTRTIREKIMGLSEKWQTQMGTSLMRETADILKPLVSMLPTLEALVSSKAVSPFELYGELMEAAGLVAQLNLSTPPPRFGKYDHNAIDRSILPIMDYVAHCLEHLSLDYALFPFKKNDRVFSFKLRSAYLPSNAQELFVGLRAKPGIQARHMELWMKEAVIVSDEALQKVQSKRMTGAARARVEDEKLYEMSPPRDITLFFIVLDSQFIQPNQYLHIFNPSDSEHSRPADIILFVAKDEEAAAQKGSAKAA